MSRNLKSIVLGALALVLFVTVACGGDDDDVGPTAENSTQTVTSALNAPTLAPGTPQPTTALNPSPTSMPTNTPLPTATATVTPTPTPAPPTATPDLTPPLVVIAKSGGPLGGTASVTIRTNPGIPCGMRLVLPDGLPTNSPDVDDQVAASDGTITWTFGIDPSYPTGTARAEVTCQGSRRAALIDFTPS